MAMMQKHANSMHMQGKGAVTVIDKRASNEKIEKLREEEAKPVKGIFKNLECSGGAIRFVYRKFKGDPVDTYTLEDGKEYELPLGVARHLNTNCAYPVYKSELSNERLVDVPGRMVNRYAFLSTEFR